MIWALRKRASSRRHDPMPTAAPAIATERSAINRLLQKGAPDSVVLFGATWFKPSQRMAEQLAKQASRHALSAMSIDIDEAPDLVEQYRVTAVPSLLLLRGGEVVGRRLGEIKDTALDDWIADAQAAG
jgi:thioredoxin-like negative regulator of GroEL